MKYGEIMGFDWDLVGKAVGGVPGCGAFYACSALPLGVFCNFNFDFGLMFRRYWNDIFGFKRGRRFG